VATFTSYARGGLPVLGVVLYRSTAIVSKAVWSVRMGRRLRRTVDVTQRILRDVAADVQKGAFNFLWVFGTMRGVGDGPAGDTMRLI